MLLILITCSIVLNDSELFERMQPFVARIKPELHLGTDFYAVLRRTDQDMRDLLELTLHASLVTCEEHICDKILTFGENNTFILRIRSTWLSEALSHFPASIAKDKPFELFLILMSKKKVSYEENAGDADED